MDEIIEKPSIGEKLEKILFNFFIGRYLRREEVKWEGIITEEGMDKFIERLYKARPIAERIYQGSYGGFPIPPCLTEDYK